MGQKGTEDLALPGQGLRWNDGRREDSTENCTTPSSASAAAVVESGHPIRVRPIHRTGNLIRNPAERAPARKLHSVRHFEHTTAIAGIFRRSVLQIRADSAD